MQSQEIILYEDLYGMWYMPLWQRWWFKALIVVGIAVAVGLLLFFLMRLYKYRKQRVIPAVLRQLQALKPEQFVGRERRKEFYTIVTKLLKTYFEYKYQVPVQAKTDEELLELFSDVHLDTQQSQVIRGILHDASIAKFAPEDVAQQGMSDAVAASITLVRSLEKKAKR